jgi:hypothetical protein
MIAYLVPDIAALLAIPGYYRGPPSGVAAALATQIPFGNDNKKESVLQ